MASFKSARDLLLVGVQEGLLDEEFLLLHDLNISTNSEYQYKDYARFNLQEKLNAKVNSDKERIRMFYLAYQINIYIKVKVMCWKFECRYWVL